MISHTAQRLAPLLLAASLVLALLPATAAAQSPAGFSLLLAKSWVVGGLLVSLGILLGGLAVLVPSMRKSLRRKDN